MPARESELTSPGRRNQGGANAKVDLERRGDFRGDLRGIASTRSERAGILQRERIVEMITARGLATRCRCRLLIDDAATPRCNITGCDGESRRTTYTIDCPP